METLSLKGNPFSPYTRAVRITLLEKGVPFNFVELGPPDLKEPSHLALHPFGKMPVLEVEGSAIFETTAILRYVDEHFSGTVRLQPADTRDRARMAQWVSAACAYIYPNAFTKVFVQQALLPKFGMETDTALVQEGLETTKTHLETLSQALESGTLAGNGRLTLADILCASVLDPLRHLESGQGLLNSYSRVSKWLTSLNTRDSFSVTAMPG